MYTTRRVLAVTVVWILGIDLLLATFSPAADLYKPFRALHESAEAAFHRKQPRTGQDTAIERLAMEIDWLEHHIDEWGTIVAKHPDVWGEARLTKHRDEYERMLSKELGSFQIRINAAISQSDQALLLNAAALTAAIGEGAGSPPNLRVSATSQFGLTDAEIQRTEPRGAFAGTRFESFDDGAKIGLEPTIHLDQLSRYLNHLHELRRINEGDDTSDSPGYALNLVRIPASVLPGKKTREGFGAEMTVTATPYLSNALLATAFRNLVVNDLVDQLRLPITRLAENIDEFRMEEQKGWTDIAKELETGYQQAIALERGLSEIEAEVDLQVPGEFSQAITAPPRITPIEDIDQALAAAREYQSYLEGKTQAHLTRGVAVGEKLRVLRELEEQVTRSMSERGGPKNAEPTDLERLQEDLKLKEKEISPRLLGIDLPIGIEANNQEISERYEAAKARRKQLYKKWESLGEQGPRTKQDGRDLGQTLAAMSSDLDQKAETQAFFVAPGSRARRARHPLPPSQVVEVFGGRELRAIAKQFLAAYQGRHVRWSGGGKDAREQRVHILDVQRFLQAEIESAYELLSAPDHLIHWVAAVERDDCTQSELAVAVRSRHDEHIRAKREIFLQNLHRHQPSGRSAENQLTTTDALTWAVVVQSALLNEQLARDIANTAQAKGCYGALGPEVMYYLPATAMNDESYQDAYLTAAESFKEYVRCRWPIHVFALDPVTQEQNVADVSSRRRELQLALALAFVSGRISARNMTSYARRLETDIETISLNRSVVAFSHGNDTFGWRFTPRVQTPPPPGNLTAFGQTLFGGPSRESDMNQRMLEPGMRECVAMVLMPSFVPYCDFDVRTNWFKLTNAKNSERSMHDVMKLSRSITAMRNSAAQCAQCAHLYREGEVERLLRRVHQLDRELPLQTMRVQIPYENTLGGFEMFNTGLTDLAPELVGWYGAPGIVVGADGNVCGTGQSDKETGSASDDAVEPLPPCPGTGTTLFLVGDNLSVHDTRVIAGGVCIPDIRLISRQILQVTIPDCVNTVIVDGDEYVDVHAATPYGVTSHLHVPTVPKSEITETELQQIKTEVERVATDVERVDRGLSKVDKTLGQMEKKIASLVPKSPFKIGTDDELKIWFSYDNVAGRIKDLELAGGGANPSSFALTLTEHTDFNQHFVLPRSVKIGVAVKHGGAFLGPIRTLRYPVTDRRGKLTGHTDYLDLNGEQSTDIGTDVIFEGLKPALEAKVNKLDERAAAKIERTAVLYLILKDDKALPIRVDKPIPVTLCLRDSSSVSTSEMATVGTDDSTGQREVAQDTVAESPQRSGIRFISRDPMN